jgi:hypothetical protein
VLGEVSVSLVGDIVRKVCLVQIKTNSASRKTWRNASISTAV